MTRSPSPRAGRARAILPLALTSVVILSVLTAPSAASAAWSARVTATGSVSAGSLAVAFGGALPLATFTNSSLSSTGSVSISNTTSSATAPPADLEVVFAGPSTPFAAATNLVVWPVADASGCLATSTPGAGAVAGNWASGVTLAIAALSRGATQIACVRTVRRCAPGCGIDDGLPVLRGRRAGAPDTPRLQCAGLVGLGCRIGSHFPVLHTREFLVQHQARVGFDEMLRRHRGDRGSSRDGSRHLHLSHHV